MKKIPLNILVIFLIPLIVTGCSKSKGETDNFNFSKNKIKAIHVFSNKEFDPEEFDHLSELGVESIVLVPYFYQRALNTDSLFLSSKNGYEWTERDEGIKKIAEVAKSKGIKIILKPHIWLRKSEGEAWREAIMPEGKNWSKWSAAYKNAILHYARMAEEFDSEVFCIGTELSRLALEKPNFWREIIVEVRKVYHGKLTYAANWYEEYQKIEFWDDLDFIGVQAYFPLSGEESHNTESIKKSWQGYKKELFEVSEKYKKPILFTEIGYKSCRNTSFQPWLWDEHWQGDSSQFHISESDQNDCYRLFFEIFWEERQFAGVMLWNWKIPYKDFGGNKDPSFTPQQKQAEATISSHFNKIN